MAAILYVLMAAISARAWSRVSSLRASVPVRLLAGMVVGILLLLLPVQAVATLEMMGWIVAIHLWALVGVQAAILAAMLVWARTASPKSPDNSKVASRGGASRTFDTLLFDAVPFYLWVAGAALAGSYLIFAANLFTSYPSGSDALTYHLPVALHWLQSGSMRIPSSIGWQYGLPGNAEIGMMLMLSTGWQALAPMVNVFALVVLGLATYVIAERVARGNRITALAATLIALSMPIVEFQAFSGYVDLFGTAFLVAAVALFLSRRDFAGANSDGQWSWALVFLSMAACGVSVGTKPVFYVYAAVYCLLVAVTWVRESTRSGREAGLLLGVIVFGVLLPSGFWFGRAFAETGNPLFPLQVKVGQHILLRGFAPSQITANEFSDKFVRRRAEWIVYPWTEYLRNPGDQLIPYSEGSGTGAAFAAFVPIGLLFAMYRLSARKGGGTEGVLLVIWMGLLVVWWTSLQRMPRFGLPLLVLACVLSAPLLTILLQYRGRAFGILLVGCVVVTCGISMFVPLRELGGRLKSHGWARSSVYGYPRMVDDLPPGTTLLNNSGVREANFALAGKKLSNRVIADFDVPNPITPEFLAERHVDYVVEAVQESGGKVGYRQTAQFAPGVHESVSAMAGGKRWLLWPVRQQAHMGSPGAAAK